MNYFHTYSKWSWTFDPKYSAERWHLYTWSRDDVWMHELRNLIRAGFIAIILMRETSADVCVPVQN